MKNVAFAAGMSVVLLASNEVGTIDSRYAMIEHGKGDDTYWTPTNKMLPDMDGAYQYRVSVSRNGMSTSVFVRAHEMIAAG